MNINEYAMYLLDVWERGADAVDYAPDIHHLRQKISESEKQECETCAAKRKRLMDTGFLKSPLREAALNGLAETSREIEQEPVGEVLNVQWMSNSGGWLIGFHSKRRLYKGDKLYVEPMSIKPENIDTKSAHVDGVAIEPSRAQTKQIIQGLYSCHHSESQYEFLRSWIRDWTLHKVALLKREWQGLDDNEIQATDHFCGDVFEFARAIEQRLKEKNNG